MGNASSNSSSRKKKKKKEKEPLREREREQEQERRTTFFPGEARVIEIEKQLKLLNEQFAEVKEMLLEERKNATRNNKAERRDDTCVVSVDDDDDDALVGREAEGEMDVRDSDVGTSVNNLSSKTCGNSEHTAKTTTATVLADDTANVPTTVVSYLQGLKALDETSASVSDRDHSEVESSVLGKPKELLPPAKEQEQEQERRETEIGEEEVEATTAKSDVVVNLWSAEFLAKNRAQKEKVQAAIDAEEIRNRPIYVGHGTAMNCSMSPGVAGYRATRVVDTEVVGVSKRSAMLQSISAMPDHDKRSVEEMRCDAWSKAGEPGQANGQQGGFGSAQTVGAFGASGEGAFGGSSVGGVSTSPSGGFGQPSSTPVFGHAPGFRFGTPAKPPFENFRATGETPGFTFGSQQQATGETPRFSFGTPAKPPFENFRATGETPGFTFGSQQQTTGETPRFSFGTPGNPYVFSSGSPAAGETPVVVVGAASSTSTAGKSGENSSSTVGAKPGPPFGVPTQPKTVLRNNWAWKHPPPPVVRKRR